MRDHTCNSYAWESMRPMRPLHIMVTFTTSNGSKWYAGTLLFEVRIGQDSTIQRLSGAIFERGHERLIFGKSTMPMNTQDFCNLASFHHWQHCTEAQGHKLNPAAKELPQPQPWPKPNNTDLIFSHLWPSLACFSETRTPSKPTN